MTPRRSASRRKPFAAIRKGIVEHVLDGRICGPRFGVYVWLHLRADHTTGMVRTSASQIAAELRVHPVTVRQALITLRRDGYVRYACAAGARQPYEILIEKYHEHFEDPATAEQVPLQVPLQVALQVPLQVDDLSSGNHEPESAPKNKEVRSKEVRSKATPALRVRSADVALPGEVSLTRSDARAQVPVPVREALSLFFDTTGRESVTAEDFAYFARLDQTHTPAVISKGILAAAARFAHRKQDVGELTLQYVWESLKHFTTRRGPAPEGRQGEGARTAAPGSSERPKYPPGVTRLRW